MPLTVGTAGPHRPRQDVARPGADREGHRPPARGAGARDLDRPRLRAARPAGRAAALADRRARARALRPQHGRRRDRDRPLPARRRRRRGRAPADARAPRDPVAARDRARRRRGHEGGRGRRGDARARARGGARARPGRRGRRGQREDRRSASTSCAPRSRAPRTLCCSNTIPPRPARLYVDRVFSLRGIGTVATGTLWSGSIGEGDVLRAEPARARRAGEERPGARPCGRARRGRAAGRARAAGRLARRAAARRRARRSRRVPVRATGSTSCSRSSRRSTTARGCTSTTARRPMPARVVRAGERYAQLRLAAPVVAARGDRVVLRGETTVGGGTRHRPRAAAPRRSGPLRARGARRDDDRTRPSSSTASGRSRTSGSRSCAPSSRAGIAAADPLDPGVDAPGRAVGEGRARATSRSSGAARGSTCPARPRASASAPRRPSRARGRARGRRARDREGRGRRARPLPRAGGRLVRLGDGYAVSAAAYERARELVRRGVRRRGRIALARFRDLAGCGRRDAQLLLERLDADGVTRRVGDERVLRRSASRSA